MKISVSGRQMSVRNSLRELIEDKLAKFERFFGDDAEAYVTVSSKNGKQTVELTIVYSGTVFRSEESGSSFKNAVIRAVSTLERQIRKNKTRLLRRVREGAFAAIEVDSDIEPVEEEERFDIRVKSFPAKPMDVEEAILQMNLSGHTFYAFLDSESGKHAVVYHQNDGGYGLLLPE